MPRTVNLGILLYVIAAILTPVVGVFDPVPDGAAAAQAASLLAVLLPVFALKAFLIYKAYVRRGWARIGLGAFTGLGLAAYAPGLVHSLKTLPLIGIADLALVLAEAAAVILLFLPDSNRWYRMSEAEAAGR